VSAGAKRGILGVSPHAVFVREVEERELENQHAFHHRCHGDRCIAGLYGWTSG
jgi:hypothetical protein